VGLPFISFFLFLFLSFLGDIITFFLFFLYPRAPEDVYQRARIPAPAVFNYKVKPQSSIEPKEAKQASKKGANAGENSALSRMKEAGGGRSVHALSMSVEGRGLK